MADELIPLGTIVLLEFWGPDSESGYCKSNTEKQDEEFLHFSLLMIYYSGDNAPVDSIISSNARYCIIQF